MSLSKKKSRPITVNGYPFRFQVSTSKLDEDFNFSLNLTVVRDISHGKSLQVKGLVTRDFWLDFSDGSGYEVEKYPAIKLANIAEIIQKAISMGWDSSPNGKSLVFTTTNDQFFKSQT